MDPLIHVALPALLLLAMRLDPRSVLLFAPLAIVPDLDVVHLHRATFHNVFVTVALPLAFVTYSRLRRPEWTMNSLLALFFLSSHLVLDLGGVSVFWPFVTDLWYLDTNISISMRSGIDIGFDFDYGWRDYAPMGESSLLSGTGFALLFLVVLVLVVFRKEAISTLRKYWDLVKQIVRRFLK